MLAMAAGVASQAGVVLKVAASSKLAAIQYVRPTGRIVASGFERRLWFGEFA